MPLSCTVSLPMTSGSFSLFSSRSRAPLRHRPTLMSVDGRPKALRVVHHSFLLLFVFVRRHVTEKAESQSSHKGKGRPLSDSFFFLLLFSLSLSLREAFELGVSPHSEQLTPFGIPLYAFLPSRRPCLNFPGISGKYVHVGCQEQIHTHR